MHQIHIVKEQCIGWKNWVVRLVQLLVQVEQLNPVFGLFGLAKEKNQPNFSMQWRKGGDFLSDFLKKYYLPIA
ncbi:MULTISPECIES: hypothetical protein [Bacillus cereus group]|uniref:hypothetical protein n=1 Tax=Bacillus cereus group TaxID=86661 RepID=UPI0011438258|nr:MULTISPECIES: hypothetical protein [Bacillus cereus group]QWG31187.1 hypothetical protein EXW58_27445 [Bacillus mycoides]